MVAKISSKMPYKKWRKLGTRCFPVMKAGTSKHKKICRIVYSEKTLAPRHPVYWFELYPGQWRNTSKKGIRKDVGIVVGKSEFWRLKKKL